MKNLKMTGILVSLAIFTFSCNLGQPVSNVSQINFKTNISKIPPISGNVEFPNQSYDISPYEREGNEENSSSSLKILSLSYLFGESEGVKVYSPFTTFATTSDIALNATVSLIYPPDHPTKPNVTEATGLSDVSGNFNINPDNSFHPAVNDIFILEARRRIGSSGNDLMSLRTYIKWNGNSWDSITYSTNSGNASIIYINIQTTALTIIDSYNSNLSPAQTIHSINETSGVSIPDNQIGGSTVSRQIVNDVSALVSFLLGQNADPDKFISFANNSYYINKEPKHSVIALNSGIDCPNCNLKNEDLSNKNLDNRNLKNADLSGAILINSSLKGTDLTNSNLSGAILTGGDLTGANITGTIFSGAIWTNGIICNTDSVGMCNTGTFQALQATNITSTSFTANWNNISGVSGYKLFVDGIQYPDESTIITNNFYRIIDLSPGTNHTYYVVALLNPVNVSSSTIRLQTANNYMISTIAGNGLGSYSGDGGYSTAAQVFGPSGVTVDSSGNIYIADTGNHRIRKINASTGIISSVAGIGTPGYSGDGGQATSAQLKNPSGIAIDNSGNIYIVDLLNQRVRKVNANTGIITTVAGNGFAASSGDGGQATSANLSNPSGVAIDNSGNIYIADTFSVKIRKVNAITGVISTIAGYGNNIYTGVGYSGDGGQGSSATLNYPYGVAVDNAGNIYIADTQNNRIRKVNAITGIITTVAGGGSSSEDGEQATFAQLKYPKGVAVDSAGNIYISDTWNRKIRKVNAVTGIITTIAGNGLYGYLIDGGESVFASLGSPEGLALDGSRNIYIADSNNNRIRKLTK